MKSWEHFHDSKRFFNFLEGKKLRKKLICLRFHLSRSSLYKTKEYSNPETRSLGLLEKVSEDGWKKFCVCLRLKS